MNNMQNVENTLPTLNGNDGEQQNLPKEKKDRLPYWQRAIFKRLRPGNKIYTYTVMDLALILGWKVRSVQKNIPNMRDLVSVARFLLSKEKTQAVLEARQDGYQNGWKKAMEHKKKTCEACRKRSSKFLEEAKKRYKMKGIQQEKDRVYRERLRKYEYKDIAKERIKETNRKTRPEVQTKEVGHR